MALSNTNDFNKFQTDPKEFERTRYYNALANANAAQSPSRNPNSMYIANNGVAYGNSPDAFWHNVGTIGGTLYKQAMARQNDGIVNGKELLGTRPVVNGKALSDAQWAQQGGLTQSLAQGSSIIGDPSLLTEEMAQSLLSPSAAASIGGESIGTLGTTGAGSAAAAGGTAGAEAGINAASFGLSPLAIGGGIFALDQGFNNGRITREVGKAVDDFGQETRRFFKKLF